MRTPLVFYVDRHIGLVGFAKHPDGLVGRVEVWALGATRMRALTNHFCGRSFEELSLNRFDKHFDIHKGRKIKYSRMFTCLVTSGAFNGAILDGDYDSDSVAVS